MYPICYQWVSGGYLQPEPTMYSRCFCWFPGPLAPSVHASSHLRHIVGSQRQVLEMMASSHGPGLNKILQGKTVKGPLRTSRTFGSLVDVFSTRIWPMRIVASGTGIPTIVRGFEPLKALHPGVVDILGEGDKWRRRSIGSRHFVWRMGWWFRGQWLMLLLSAHDRHALLWSSLPLLWDSSVYRAD